jgi:hypothetical protein
LWIVSHVLKIASYQEWPLHQILDKAQHTLAQ